MTTKVDSTLRARLEEAADRTDGLAALVAFRDAGGSQEAAYATLESLRSDEDDRDDAITDLMDLVCGWCAPESWIYLELEFPFLVEVPGWDRSIAVGDRHEALVTYFLEQAIEWCLTARGYRFKTERSAKLFEAEWARD